jgi:zinc protease
MKTWLTVSMLAAIVTLTPAVYCKTFQTEHWQTSNGAQVVFYRAIDIPMLDINVGFAAGSAFDDDHFGLSTLTTSLLNQGNGNLDATKVAEQFADVGAQYNSETSRDMVILQLKTLTDNEALKKALDNFSLVINQPRFKTEAFNQEKNQQLMKITQTQESPDELATMVFFEKLYQNHPYAHPINGTKERVSQLTVKHVRNFYKNYFVASNATIVLVGAIESRQAHEIAEQLVKALPRGHAAVKTSKAPALSFEEQITINYPSSQTMLRLGQVGIDHNANNYFPLMVGNYILGGGSLVSRLSHEVREKQGLTYGVISQFIPMPGDGPFLISLSTQNEKALTALKITRTILADFLTSGPSNEELIAAKQYLTGSFPLSLASNSSIAGMLLRIAFYHLPDDYLDTYTDRIAAVTLDDIKKSFANHIKPNKMLLVAVGKNIVLTKAIGLK